MMQTITKEYADLNRQLHEDCDHYGTSGQRWGDLVARICKHLEIKAILDYGCGQETLKKLVRSSDPTIKVTGYDPAVEGKETPPEPHRLVVCTDVLEHVEPDLLQNVLKNLYGLTLQVGFFVIATRPAIKTLADGRNAHLIIQPMEWWIPNISQHWRIMDLINFGGEFLVIVQKNHLNPTWTNYEGGMYGR